MNKITKEIYEKYCMLIDYGYSQRAACLEIGVPRSSMQDYIRENDQKWDTFVFAEESPSRKPVVAFYDLECAPSIAVAFGRFKQNIGVDNVVSEGGWLISAVVKIGNDVTKLVLTPEEAIRKDDSRIVANLWEIFEGVDIAVAQNGDRFDWPLLKTRCIKNGLPPMKTVKHVDTLKIAKQLKFNSNRLDSLGKELGIGRKVKHEGIDLWIRCMTGDPTALQEMLDYNVGDVGLLETVYNRIRAFDSKHPNVSHFYEGDETRCPVCGSTNVEETGNKVYTPVSEFAEMKCGDCGHRARARKTLNTKEKRGSILITPKTTG